jgi:hypothetical protein
MELLSEGVDAPRIRIRLPLALPAQPPNPS